MVDVNVRKCDFKCKSEHTIRRFRTREARQARRDQRDALLNAERMERESENHPGFEERYRVTRLEMK